MTGRVCDQPSRVAIAAWKSFVPFSALADDDEFWLRLERGNQAFDMLERLGGVAPEVLVLLVGIADVQIRKVNETQVIHGCSLLKNPG